MSVNLRKAALVVAAGACVMVMGSDRARARPATQFEVLTGFSSKESCSCAFVVEQADEYCKEFGKTGGYEVEVVIDRGQKSVTATFLGTSRTARFTDGQGCVADPLP